MDKPERKTNKAAAQPRRASNSNPPPSRLMMEQMMRDIHRAMEGHEFATTEDANAFLATLTGPGLGRALQNAAPPSAKEQAQELAYRAMDAPSARQAKKLAQQALAKDPDCVDAIVVITDLEARTLEEVVAGLKKAVEAGERSLGAEFFTENKGYFWGLMETRPYMRARMELAELLPGTGRLSEAITHFEALMELNPNDNQGVRDVLLGCYLAGDNLDCARRLLRDYREDASAVFAWGRTLERFLSGDQAAAQRALRQARKQNRFVELYLTMQRPLPTEMPEMYSPGSDEEAILCLNMLSGAWADHPLAASWLWEQLGFRTRSSPPSQAKLF